MIRFPIIHVLEVLVGGFLFALGLLYLNNQLETMNKLTATVNEVMLEDRSFYQQNHNFNINILADDELYAVVMGYREYPVAIDGVTIDTDGNNYDYYITLIKAGAYKKSYQCDSSNNIIQIIYTYIGVA